MLAVLRAQNLLKSMKDSVLDEVYTNNLPTEEVDDSTRSVALITDVRSDLALPGNDDFHAQNKEVEVQIYYKLDGVVRTPVALPEFNTHMAVHSH